ncbi:hypothetical protein [Sphingomonas immobilis]|uniref:STAS/SEC14 domain-containing protein n=1 Tax=Sphingomonas immobilis TaxID=3063997 RepID=A0ABT8ZWY3_9SPHN|nr:hypothetical protein [Sphingomonas sp. CA1-15]MDO7842084.1 hypothetical protein [Sphingomonas sp. CA1-15]
MLELTLDPVAKILKLETTGYLTVEDVRRYRYELLHMASQARERFGRVRMYVDSTDGRVQPANVIAEFADLPSIIQGPDDRMAVAVGSALSLLQVKRSVKSDQERAFLTPEEALDWLNNE